MFFTKFIVNNDDEGKKCRIHSATGGTVGAKIKTEMSFFRRAHFARHVTGAAIRADVTVQTRQLWKFAKRPKGKKMHRQPFRPPPHRSPQRSTAIQIEWRSVAGCTICDYTNIAPIAGTDLSKKLSCYR
ncbi:hypothetical protein V9T40_005330 [Parthenolecanium corni]|uniref:Uncharacterized protein n=1 Tax=Parthenolecanium corni TaxID=536013 RepID=A0AAN9TVQ4_9HEMI